MTSIKHPVRKLKERLAQRRADRPERLRRRAEAQAHRRELKRGHESDPWGGGGGGGV
jgi:hypothetical protein